MAPKEYPLITDRRGVLIDFRVSASDYVYQDYELHTRTLKFMFKKFSNLYDMQCKLRLNTFLCVLG